MSKFCILINKYLRATLNKGPRPIQIHLWFCLHGIILDGKPIGLEHTKKMSLKENPWFGEPNCKLGSKVVHVFVYCFFPLLFLPSLFKLCENGRHVIDWRHCYSTPPPQIFTNFKVDMLGFVNFHKVIARRNAFLALPSAQNKGELKSGVKSERLKCQFSQEEGYLNLQEIFKLVPIPKKTNSSIVHSKSFFL